jgi:hypothetical protein
LVTNKRSRAVIVKVTVAFAFVQRKSVILPIIAHQDKLSCRRNVTVVFATDPFPSAAWNGLNTISLKAV